ncbi:hypothetical protein [Kribbella sp.]|uniref:hypothetical protein n=1 Tax=Kribbella sp. TaxID=1871183 RepID=UPI002D2D031C|nr:hypothetical protein [Kribbella sp.]HZX08394.1 hypothetical protein [Kribbella sp.]
MHEVRDVTAELNRLADAEEFDPLDTAPLLDRGHRGRRRRKIFTVGGTVAVVAVAAITAGGVLPNLTQARETPAAGGAQHDAYFEPVPGIAHGEAAVGVPVSQAEAYRRCKLRLPDLKGPVAQVVGGLRVGDRTNTDIRIAKRIQLCTVPGGDRPTAALLAKLRKDPLPADPATQLLNCSAQSWVDVTKWHIVASARSKTWPSMLLTAVSPTGRHAITCEIEKNSLDGGMVMRGTAFLTLDSLVQGKDPILTPAKGSRRADLYTGRDLSGQKCGTKMCYEVRGWGRVAATATRIHLQFSPTAQTDIPVTDGWFAYIWRSQPTTAKLSDLKITALDKNGKVVRTLP